MQNKRIYCPHTAKNKYCYFDVCNEESFRCTVTNIYCGVDIGEKIPDECPLSVVFMMKYS